MQSVAPFKTKHAKDAFDALVAKGCDARFLRAKYVFLAVVPDEVKPDRRYGSSRSVRPFKIGKEPLRWGPNQGQVFTKEKIKALAVNAAKLRQEITNLRRTPALKWLTRTKPEIADRFDALDTNLQDFDDVPALLDLFGRVNDAERTLRLKEIVEHVVLKTRAPHDALVVAMLEHVDPPVPNCGSVDALKKWRRRFGRAPGS